jgi:DNA-binding IclR family transcriptional regulator
MKGMPTLTARQRTFLRELQRLYREHRKPVHYTAIAEKVGVNRFSAYDMLKVLEKKGVASSTYALAAGHSGPGRSMVVFAPTELGTALTAPGPESLAPGDDWFAARERLLKKLRDARRANPRAAMAELLARLAEPSAPLTFCTEMVAVLLLNMRRARARAGGIGPFRVLAALRSAGEGGLEALAGLSIGATLASDDDSSSSLTERLVDHVRGYQRSLPRLGDEGRQALVQFLEDALEALD